MDIEVKQVSLTLGKKQILNQVSLKAESGKVTGIIGPNGSGKSTLLKCVYRVLKPDYGEVLIDNKSIYDIPIKESAKTISVLAQYTDVPFDFTVAKMVIMGRYPHKRALESDSNHDYDIVNESLRTVEMEQFKERSFSTLSGGEKQRVLLARALAQDTPILILDEPTNHLDIKYQLQIMTLCRKLNKTVLATVHDLNIAAQFCDNLYAIKDGHIINSGKPSTLLDATFIKELYETEAETVTDRTGKPRIFFYA